MRMKDYEEILTEFNKIIKDFIPQGQLIDEGTDLVADLGLDSLKVMKIIESVEDNFDISIPLNILPDVRTVKDLVVQIHKISEAE